MLCLLSSLSFCGVLSFNRRGSTFLNELWRWAKTSDTLFMLDYEMHVIDETEKGNMMGYLGNTGGLFEFNKRLVKG